MKSEDPKSVSGLLLKAVRWLSQPLVRLLIDKGITYPVFCDLLKGLYIETAEKELKSKGVKPTLSRIFVQTGIHRRETKRVLEEVLTQDEKPFQVSTLGGLIVSRWMALSEFHDEHGKPRKLPRLGTEGEPGFNDLVESANKDVHPRVILDEWLELGVVSLDSDDRVCLNQTAFVPSSGYEEKVFFFGRHIHDHINTCVHNMTDDSPAKLERSVYYSHLSPESVEKLQQLASEKAAEIIELINEQALKLKQSDSEKQNADHRIRFGSFWYDNTHESISKKEEDKS